MRISDWSSDVCSSDLAAISRGLGSQGAGQGSNRKCGQRSVGRIHQPPRSSACITRNFSMSYVMFLVTQILGGVILYFTYRGVFDLLTAFITVILMFGLQFHVMVRKPDGTRSEELTSELQSLLRTSYALFCLKKKKKKLQK